jgi:uncharacterized protein YjbI with pentapeptide repeats
MSDILVHERDVMLEGILAVARREMLVLAAARHAADGDAALVAAGRLRWQLASAQQYAMQSLAGYARVHARLNDVLMSAQRWLSAYAPAPPSPEQCQRLLLRLAEPYRLLARIDATGATLVELELDALPLAQLALVSATLIAVTALGAQLDEVDATGATIAGSGFGGASIHRGNFEQTAIDNSDFTRANLEASRWTNATLSRCVAFRAVLMDARMDGATFTDCDFREADFQSNRPTGVGARFVRCDLRETNWRGRSLRGASFIDCKLWGAVEADDASEAVIERPDLSRAGDGSRIGDKHDAASYWSCPGVLAIHLWY